MVRCNFLQFDDKKWGSPSSFSSCKGSKLKLRLLLAGHIVAMVIYCVTKIIPTRSQVTGQLKSGYYDPSKSAGNCFEPP